MTYRENGQDVSSFCDGRFSFLACRSIPWQLYEKKETERRLEESISQGRRARGGGRALAISRSSLLSTVFSTRDASLAASAFLSGGERSAPAGAPIAYRSTGTRGDGRGRARCRNKQYALINTVGIGERNSDVAPRVINMRPRGCVEPCTRNNIGA